MSINDRVIREKKSHEENDVLKQSIKLKKKFNHITLYPGIQKMTKKFEDFFEIKLNKSNFFKSWDQYCLINLIKK